MAADASAGAIIIAWVVTGIGIWFIANTFRILSAARPELTNGLYTYAEKGFGKLIGFFVRTATGFATASRLLPTQCSSWPR